MSDRRLLVFCLEHVNPIVSGKMLVYQSVGPQQGNTLDKQLVEGRGRNWRLHGAMSAGVHWCPEHCILILNFQPFLCFYRKRYSPFCELCLEISLADQMFHGMYRNKVSLELHQTYMLNLV
jgi:hypothetical protein